MRGVFVVLAMGLSVTGCDRRDKQESAPAVRAVRAVTPSADEILEAYVTAIGGREAFGEIDAMRTTMTVSVENAGLYGTMQIEQQRPRRSYLRMELKGAGLFEEGCDGTVCWKKSDSEGVRVLGGEELEEELRAAMLDSALRWRELYTRVDVVDAVDFAGRPAWKVVMTPPSGRVETTYYHRVNHLLLGSDEIVNGQRGEMRVRTTVMAWRTFGPIRQPSRLDLTSEDRKLLVHIDDVEINPAIPVGRFDLPPEVKARLDGAQVLEAPEAPEAPPAP